MTLGDSVQSSSLVNHNRNNTEGTTNQPPSLLCNGTSYGPETVSPRKCLSLRKRRRSNSAPIETSTDQQNEPCTSNHAPNLTTHTANNDSNLAPDQNTSVKEKSSSERRAAEKMVSPGTQQQERPRGFVLGLGEEDSREEAEDDSQREINITIAGDSQFEASAESQLLLPTDKPPNPNTSAVLEHVHMSSPAPQGSIFSNVGASKRISRTVGSPHSNEARTCARDPFEFDSPSHDTPVEFIPRKKRGVDKSCEDVGVQRGEDMGEQDGEDVGVQIGEDVGEHDGENVGRGECVHTGEVLREGIATSAVASGETVDPVTCEEVECGGGERVEGTEASQVDGHVDRLSSRECVHTIHRATETEPISTVTPLSHSTHPHYSTPSHPSQQQPMIVRTVPSTLHTVTSHDSHINTSTLPISTLPQFSFTSPTSRVSHREICDASIQYRAREERYAVRHVHTFRHSVEVKVVSQVVYDGERIVDGLSTVWQVSTLTMCTPLSSQNAKMWT